MVKNYTIKLILVITGIVLAGILITTCTEDEPLEAFFEEEELLISDWLEEHEDEFSTLLSVLEYTQLKPALNAYGHYTFFAPDNDAFDDFLVQQGKSSIEDFEKDYLTTLVKYHLIDIEIESSYFRNGALTDTTYSGDHLIITFLEGGLENILVNDARITERDINVENGIIHKIDKVMPPVVGSVFDRLKENGNFSLFAEALELTGLADTLDIIFIELNEDIHFRTRFTLFIEPDEVYGQNGISSLDDLVSKYSDTGDPADEGNGLYQYVAYHILPSLNYLNEMDSFNYPTLAENKLIHVSLEDRIYLNRPAGDKDGNGSGEIITVKEEESNQTAKNGVFHSIDNILEPVDPAPVYMIIDLTDYQGIYIGREYDEDDLEDIEGISAENTGIWFRNSILGDGETNLQTTSNRTGWVVEFELPPIQRGQYDLILHWASHGTNCGWAQGFWDGARFGSPFSFRHQKRWPGVSWKRDYNTSQWMGRILLTETTPHTIKFISLADGYGNFDYLALWPVEE